MIYWIKFLRNCLTAATCCRRGVHDVGGCRFETLYGWNWSKPSAADVNAEVAPLLAAVDASFSPVAIDAGAALGMFSIPLLRKFPSVTVHAFEPAASERILLRRNARLNRVADRLFVQGVCLWNADTVLSFRSHGYIGGVKGVSEPVSALPAEEKIKAVTLDSWWQQNGRPQVGLVKMDIEGSEPEALDGGREMIAKCKPLLLIEAYHMRGGVQTFSGVCSRLSSWGFDVSRSSEASGLVVARG